MLHTPYLGCFGKVQYGEQSGWVWCGKIWRVHTPDGGDAWLVLQTALDCRTAAFIHTWGGDVSESFKKLTLTYSGGRSYFKIMQVIFVFTHVSMKISVKKQGRCVQVATKRAGEEGKVAEPLPIPINDDSWSRPTTWHQHCPSIAIIAPIPINDNSLRHTTW